MDRDNNTKTRTANHPETKGKTKKKYRIPSIPPRNRSFLSEYDSLGVIDKKKMIGNEKKYKIVYHRKAKKQSKSE